jgi:glutathione synthase/RimK-type ligase-like ATP-grasp enzyme
LERTKVLIVRHGKGRGRHRRYMREALDALRRRRPDVFRYLVFHATGEPAPPLDSFGSIVFWLADPLREFYPSCYDQAVHLANEARARGLRLINPPEVLSNSIKSIQAGLWKAAGIPTPPVERFDDPSALKSAITRFDFPVLIRGDEQHAQKGAFVFETPDALLEAHSKSLHWPCAVSPLVDVRKGYEGSDRPEFARLFHKKRLIVADGSIRTKHIFFAPNPVVSAATCTFAQHGWWTQMGLRSSISPLERRCIENDLTYWRQREEHRELMIQACNVLGFDVAAIDYSVRDNDAPILWEANHYFQLPKLREMMLPLQRNATERVMSYYETIGDFLDRLTRHDRAEVDAITRRV